MNDRLEQIKKMLSTSPDDSFLKYALALEHEKNGNSGQAIEVIEQLLEDDDEYLGAYYKLGELYESAGKENEAIAIYKKGIRVAEKQKDTKTKNELEEALYLIE